MFIAGWQAWVVTTRFAAQETRDTAIIRSTKTLTKKFFNRCLLLSFVTRCAGGAPYPMFMAGQKGLLSAAGSFIIQDNPKEIFMRVLCYKNSKKFETGLEGGKAQTKINFCSRINFLLDTRIRD